MMRLDSGGTPHLVVLAPDSDRGRRIPLDRDYLVVGREQTCDVWFNDPHVSRTHAALQRRGNRVYEAYSKFSLKKYRPTAAR
jgi:hypothetical protein